MAIYLAVFGVPSIGGNEEEERSWLYGDYPPSFWPLSDKATQSIWYIVNIVIYWL
jgi:hypothetical protein